MSNKHTVFVLAIDGQPITPCTPCRARKLMRGGVAKPVYSKFGTFGIQMLVETRRETPETTVGVDTGSKFEGYAVVCGQENSLAVKLDLPDKKKIVRKLDERRWLRKNRRRRKCRRRPARFNNRRQEGFLSPSQEVIVDSRLKILHELFKCYPISVVGLEDVRFNHAKHRWGRHFSTVEIGKQRLRDWIRARDVELYEYRGWETMEAREKYGYKKTSSKSADKFTSHASDALALACDVGPGHCVEPGLFLVIDDTYRSVRRRLHDTQFTKGGMRDNYSRGTIFGLRKGLLVGANGHIGRLCGENRGTYRYYDEEGKRRQSKTLDWISNQFVRKEIGANSPLP